MAMDQLRADPGPSKPLIERLASTVTMSLLGYGREAALYVQASRPKSAAVVSMRLYYSRPPAPYWCANLE